MIASQGTMKMNESEDAQESQNNNDNNNPEVWREIYEAISSDEQATCKSLDNIYCKLAICNKLKNNSV